MNITLIDGLSLFQKTKKLAKEKKRKTVPCQYDKLLAALEAVRKEGQMAPAEKTVILLAVDFANRHQMKFVEAIPEEFVVKTFDYREVVVRGSLDSSIPSFAPHIAYVLGTQIQEPGDILVMTHDTAVLPAAVGLLKAGKKVRLAQFKSIRIPAWDLLDLAAAGLEVSNMDSYDLFETKENKRSAGSPLSI